MPDLNWPTSPSSINSKTKLPPLPIGPSVWVRDTRPLPFCTKTVRRARLSREGFTNDLLQTAQDRVILGVALGPLMIELRPTPVTGQPSKCERAARGAALRDLRRWVGTSVYAAAGGSDDDKYYFQLA